MIRTTRWRPDTCLCNILYTWDDTANPVVHTLQSIQKCIFHTLLSDANAYQAVKDENSSKNNAIGLLIAQVPAQAGNGKEATIRWSLNINREITIHTTGVLGAVITTLNNLANGAFPKKVTFE